MPCRTLKLGCFDIDGGRGEPARLALAIAASSPKTTACPSSAGPRPSPRCNAINRYVGKLVGLYPGDPWQAALADEVMDAVEDINTQIAATFGINDGAAKKAARDKLAQGSIALYLTRLQARLDEHGGEYFADRRLTVADLKVYVWIRQLRSGTLDYIAANALSGPSWPDAAHQTAQEDRLTRFGST